MMPQHRPDDLLTRRDGALGHLTLNRPGALNALTTAMCAAMIDALLAWRDDPAVAVVLIDHAEGRGFCAGGDVAMVRQSVLTEGGKAAREFFRTEYQLNHLLFTYPKPVIAVMDGLCMGGGAGLALPSTYRVATHNTLFAMPETAIGLFPDVGGGWYLPRLPGRLGQFLALTGARLDGAECRWSGIATHYLAAESLAEARRLIAGGADIGGALEGLSADPGPARLSGNMELINHHFSSHRLEEIVGSLTADPGKWAGKERATLQAKSPLSCKVALRCLHDGAGRSDFADEMAAEYALACTMIQQPDFAEGVRAVLVDRDNAPRWNPTTPELVDEAMLEAIFTPLPDADEWTPHGL